MRNNHNGRKLRLPVISLKWGLMAIIIVCWILPVIFIIIGVGTLLSMNLEQQIESTIAASVDKEIELTQTNLKLAMAASRAPSYTTTIRSAYQEYLKSNDKIALYTAITTYLVRQYKYEDLFETTILFFTNDLDTLYYANNRKYSGTLALVNMYRENMHEHVKSEHQKIDTSIRFYEKNGSLYMVRNIVDDKFTTYAVIIMKLDTNILYKNIGIWLLG